MDNNPSKWYEIFREKSWWKSLLSTKPVLAFSLVLVPISFVIYLIYRKGKTDNAQEQLTDVKYTPATALSLSQEAAFKQWTASRLEILELDLFNYLDGWYYGGWVMGDILFEVNSLDDRKLITLNNYYQKKRKRSMRNDLFDKFIGWLSPPKSDNYRDAIVKRLEGFGGI